MADRALNPLPVIPVANPIRSVVNNACLRAVTALLVLAPSVAAESLFLCAGLDDRWSTMPTLLRRDTAKRISRGASRSVQDAAAIRGSLSALVIFAQFAGENGGYSKPAWADDLFDSAVEGSFTHFYNETSRGQLQVFGEVLPRRYTARSGPAAYVTEAQGKMGKFAVFNLEILTQADADVDMGRFDNDGPDGVPNSGDDDGYVDVLFINLLTVPRGFFIGGATGLASLGLNTDYLSDDPAAGGGVVRVRSQFSGFGGATQRGHVFTVAAATMCHEFGHLLGLPDLFDQSSVTATGELDPVEDSAGIGNWGLMGLGTLGWGIEDGPNAFSAWSLAKLGWLGTANSRLVEVLATRRGIEQAPIDAGGEVYRISLTPDEYFLIENRQASDSYYNRNIPAGGLLIWHVDERADNDEERHKQVDLVCADGLFADLGFPGERADVAGGRDNLDFWAWDESYALEYNGNVGDTGDPFDGVTYQRFAADTNPGLRGHVGADRGNPLGIAIEEIRPLGGGVMGYNILFGQPVEGNVSSDTTWSDRIILSGDVIVDPGATLTLAAGTEVIFSGFDSRSAGFTSTRSELIIYGRLVSEGTLSAPVRLLRESVREWQGVMLMGEHDASLEQAVAQGSLILDGARYGISRQRLAKGTTIWSGNRSLPFDVLIPAGAELVVEAGSQIRFNREDLAFSGVSPSATELTVDGLLKIAGTGASPVLLTIDSESLDDLWFGLHLSSGGSIDADFMRLSQAGVAVFGEVSQGGRFRIADSQMHRLSSGLRLNLFGSATVDRSEFNAVATQAVEVSGTGTLLMRETVISSNGREGVLINNAQLQAVEVEIIDNGILDPEDPRSGLVALGGRGQQIEIRDSEISDNRAGGLDLSAWEGRLALSQSRLTGNRGDGIKVAAAERVVFEDLEISRNLGVGAVLTTTLAEVWTTLFEDNLTDGLEMSVVRGTVDNSQFVGNGLLLQDVLDAEVRNSSFANAAIALDSESSSPRLLSNRFEGNVTAVRVSGTIVPSAIEANSFVANSTAIDNRTGLVLDARSNFWGTADRMAIAAQLEGRVNFDPFLEEEGGTATAVEEQAGEGAPAVLGNSPNPFNAITAIYLYLPQAADLSLSIFDVLGRRVRSLSVARLAAGEHRIAWDGSDDEGRAVASGVYFYQLISESAASPLLGRMLLLRGGNM
ncbi:MAG: right-handed parallel beta-helix repeat-containing protein [Candidatus Latescibacterota bacterium]|nr:right-handed parallel beta-helix repeat-containing protein [Candidatus Latescibacterota bacterium]